MKFLSASYGRYMRREADEYHRHIDRRAHEMFAEDCAKRGAWLVGGFGFLSAEAQQEWIAKAKAEIGDFLDRSSL